VDSSDPASHAVVAQVVRLDLKNPPTPVGGISDSTKAHFHRRDLNYPPTAVGGIFRVFTQSLPRFDTDLIPLDGFRIASAHNPIGHQLRPLYHILATSIAGDVFLK